MVIMPLAFSSLILGVSSIGDLKVLQRIGTKTLAYYMINTAIAVLIGLLLGAIINPGEGLNIPANAKVAKKEVPAIATTLFNIVPSNPLKGLVNGNIFQVIAFALCLGIFFHVFFIYPSAVYFFAKIKPLKFLQAISSAVVTAFTTTSYSATLPVSMKSVRRKFGVSNKISSCKVICSTLIFIVLSAFAPLQGQPAGEFEEDSLSFHTLKNLQLQQDIKISLYHIFYNISSFNSNAAYGLIPWEGYSLQAKEIIDSAQSIGIRLLHEGHDLLGLTQVSRWKGRLWYWLLAGHVDTRLQLATSIVFGHEMIHLQEGFANGAATGTLVASFTGQPIGIWRAYAGAILSPLVHAVAAWSQFESSYASMGQPANIPTWISFEESN